MSIQIYGSKILRRVSRLAHDEFPLRDYVGIMFNNIDSEGYSGISCPQVGEARRIIAINLDGVRQEFVNPRIILREGNLIKKIETCPSIPGIEVEVERFDKITIKYYDKRWNEHTREFVGNISREIQKNYDILDGVLIIDHLSQSELRKMGSILNKLSMGGGNVGRVRSRYGIPAFGTLPGGNPFSFASTTEAVVENGVDGGESIDDIL